MKAERLQDRLGKQNYHEDMKIVFEPVTKSLDKTSQDITKTITNNKAIEILNNKLLEILNDRGIITSYLLSLLSKITNPEISSQFKLVKDTSSNRVIDLKINKIIPVTLHDNLLKFRDTGREFELKGYLLKTITNKNYNVDLANLSDKNLMYDFAKKMNFGLKAHGNKSTRDRTLIKILKSPSLMVSASGVSKTIFLSSDLDEMCNRLNLLLPEKLDGNKYEIINEEDVAIVDKSLEYKCLSKKQHKQLLIKCNLTHK